MADSINEILQQQKEAIDRIKGEISTLAENDMDRESAILKREIEGINAQQRTAMERLREAQESNFRFKERLFCQLSDTLDRQQDTLFLLESEVTAIAENDFAKHSVAMKLEIEKLKEKHGTVIEKIISDHDSAMKAITAKYEAALSKLAEEQEIEKLKAEHALSLKTLGAEHNLAIDKITEEYKAALAKLKKEQEKNAELKKKIYEQLLIEKVSFVNKVADKSNTYFKKSNEAEVNRLDSLAGEFNVRIMQLNNMLKKSAVETSDDIYSKLREVEDFAAKRIEEIKRKNERLSGGIAVDMDEGFNKLKEEQITDEQINAVTKKNNIEAFIGSNLINKIGIFLIIIGFILLSRFVYANITDVARGIIMFAAGGIMLGVGEFLNRKSAGVASLGLSAGGIAVLYVSGAVCYFTFGILGMHAALIICAAITAAAFYLSMRYNSKTITAFAQIGGYMPIFAITDGGLTIVYGAMVYFVALNGLSLLIAYYKKWTACYFIGFVLNLIGTGFIIALSLDSLKTEAAVNEQLLITYVFFAFLVYTAVPVLSTFRTKLRFKKADIVLMGLNTVISSVTIYSLFYWLGFGDYTGIISVAFAAVYLLLGLFVMLKMKEERNASALFFLTGLTFVILFIPFQFEVTWFSLGWLVEGTLLSAYGIIWNKRSFSRAGYLICALCLTAFVIVDMPTSHFSQYFPYKYFAVTLASLVLLGAFIYRKQQFRPNQTVYRIATVLNLLGYIVYFMTSIAHGRLLTVFSETMSQRAADDLTRYVVGTVFILAAFTFARVLSRRSFISDHGTRAISFILYFAGAVIVLYINGATGGFIGREPSAMVTAIGTAMLLVANIVSLMGLNDFIRGIILGKKLGVEFYPIIVSAFFVLLITQNMMIQLNLHFSNMIISIVFAVTAVLWIVFGFMRRYSYIRRFGLALSIFSVVKLILFDLWNQTEGYRIILFISLGVALVVISLVYQHFVKKLSD